MTEKQSARLPAWIILLALSHSPRHAFGVDDSSLISLLFPVPFSGWVTSAHPYWSTLAERPRFTCKQQEKYTNYLQTTILIDSVSFEPTEPSPHPTGVPIGATRPPALFEIIIVFGLGFFHEVEPRYQRLGTEK
jgi:hypothetical protein